MVHTHMICSMEFMDVGVRWWRDMRNTPTYVVHVFFPSHFLYPIALPPLLHVPSFFPFKKYFFARWLYCGYIFERFSFYFIFLYVCMCVDCGAGSSVLLLMVD